MSTKPIHNDNLVLKREAEDADETLVKQFLVEDIFFLFFLFLLI